ncbi:Ig-like domain-containing protein [Mycolicibacterium frederiksbergense]|uniref:Ig-like domain-containing protein n=1 Tax=Mycolicibacterium frederiksbergense TaxID=117567 RepID=UPI00265C67D1|nr:Ig-like domain-containing protein [Mycolicibacterium frederiksbergense]MDO0975176.1 Ig-like domain-containing protein [Mycolicibacterium frederiksbergense]
MAATQRIRAGRHQRQGRRRSEGLPVRRWLAVGAASAGLTASLWGLSLASPEIAVAAAEDGVSSSSDSAGGADESGADHGGAAAGSHTSGPTGDEGDDGSASIRPSTLGSGCDTGEEDEQDRATETPESDHRDGDSVSTAEDAEDADLTSAIVSRASATTAPVRSSARSTDRSDAAGAEEKTATAASDPAAETPRAAATPVVTAVPVDTEPPASDVEILIPAQSAVVSLDRPSFGRQLVASQIAALMGTGRTLVSILPVADPFKDWLYGSLSGTRRTLFNQAPWLSPTQITAEGDLPIVGTLGAVDLEGDRIRYAIVTGPVSGTVVIEDDGTFTYTPNPGFTGVDNFTVSATDLGTHINLLDPFRAASTRAALLVNQSAVTFIFNYTTGSQYWSPEARSALQRAATNLMGQFIVSAPVVVTYDITGENSSGTNTLASVDSPLTGSGAGFFPTVVQHKLLTGVDANGVAPDGEINWNFSYPWAFGDFVSGQQYDFTTVAMHELLHSFGFMSYVQPSTTATQRAWTLYDGFLQNSGGADLIGADFRFDPTLVAALTGAGGGVFFGGAGAVDAYGTLVPVYAPSSWVAGSSISHLDGTVFTGPDRQLMNPQVPAGPGLRTLSDVERAIMQDLGYTLAPMDATSTLALVGFVFLRRRCAKSVC